MKTSEQLQLDVLDELAYIPDVDSSHIAVTAKGDGVVTLQGSVPTYNQLLHAEQATKRIRGVKGVANDLKVELPNGGYGDTGIAEAAVRALQWSSSVPKDVVKVTVSNGWVTLDGKVSYEYQRRAAANAVADLFGVRGVTNHIEMEPKIKPADVKRKIEDAFRRNAAIDASHITVETNGGRVTLKGHVRSLAEKDDAAFAAWASGVSSVDNRIDVDSRLFV